ncbi:hypothetical protein F441_16910 [Phytophthora nicotianae CJ01A1]|uniref:Uncharacterized protein n=4 Tax=Phytophthora nicotianae TaxID=4792 RepID=W2YKW1_PHYNI|nr:hypothetical protein L915_16581 [Phytophthora nicotianae]ETL30603.1 hypothetical protein L916_16482 [Phytophthora nicotianae]ETO65660.1 hypothetical protein F444_17082 [Phytophthora nicotianae P1976]ETP06777.1 hypothetical protein F441_16910 [Phytophthora nicotianae CJ01A1]ETP34834.1 hypothetical protein F442_16908 [Phytophthora nicotianae P10297]
MAAPSRNRRVGEIKPEPGERTDWILKRRAFLTKTKTNL